MVARGRSPTLTDKERVFCRAYVRLGSAVKAAREADYAQPGVQGWRLMQRKVVQEEIARVRAAVDAARDPLLVADALEVRERVTWLMRHAESEETQLKAAMVLARLIGMTGEFNAGGAAPHATFVLDHKGYTTMSQDELEAEAKNVGLKLLKGGNDR